MRIKFFSIFAVQLSFLVLITGVSAAFSNHLSLSTASKNNPNLYSNNPVLDPLYNNNPYVSSNNPDNNNPDNSSNNPSNNPNNTSNDPTAFFNPFENNPKDVPSGNTYFAKSGLAEEVFLSMNYERLLMYPISAVLLENKLYLPVVDFLKGLKINHEVKNSSKLIQGLFISNNLNYAIDFELKSVKIGEKYIQMGDNDFMVVDGVYYIHPVIFENLFNVTIEANFNKLIIEVKSSDKLPAMIYHERDVERTDLKKNEEQAKVPLIYKKERNYLNAGFLDYSVSSSFMKNTDPAYNYNFDLGTEIFGGDLKTSVNGSFEKSKFRNNNFNFLWKYAFNKNSFLNQVFVGQLNYTGQYKGIINGIQITNTPVQPRVTFDKYTITETTIPNSDVELYINNQLYDYKKADALGNVFFEIPLNFGTNYIFLKIFSPTGEIIDNEKRIQIPSGFLPQGSIDYNAAIGEVNETKQKLISADVSVGVTNWLTNTSGIEKISDSQQSPTFYNSVSARLFSQYILNVTVAPKVYNRASLNASFISNLYFEAGHTQFENNNFYNRAGTEQESYFKGIIPFEFAGDNYVSQFQLKHIKYFNNIGSIKADFEQSLNFTNFRASLRFSHTRNDVSSIGENLEQVKLENITNKIHLGTDYMLPNFFFLERNMLNTNVHYNVTDKRFENLQTTFTTNISKNLKVQLKYQTGFISGSNDISAQFIFELPFMRNFVTMGQNSFSTTVQGSVGMDFNYRKFLLYNRNQVGTSAVSFRMFYDENNNGIYDKGEEILKNGKLNFKESAALDNSDENVLRVTELIPNQEYVVEVNESFLENPLLIPKYRRFSFIPSANMYKPIDIPFNISREVYGSITVKSGDQTLKFGGIEVIVKNLETEELTTLSSYFDGEIYALQFMPGDYVAYVKPSLLKNLNAVSYPEKIPFTISGNKETGSTPELNFTLEIKE